MSSGALPSPSTGSPGGPSCCCPLKEYVGDPSCASFLEESGSAPPQLIGFSCFLPPGAHGAPEDSSRKGESFMKTTDSVKMDQGGTFARGKQRKRVSIRRWSAAVRRASAAQGFLYSCLPSVLSLCKIGAEVQKVRFHIYMWCDVGYEEGGVTQSESQILDVWHPSQSQ